MVVDKRNRMGRIFGDQRLLEQLAQIVILALLGCDMEVLMQGHIEKIEGELGRFQILLDRAVFVLPIFTDHVKIIAMLRADRLHEILHELIIDVFDGIQAEAVDTGFFDVPIGPFFDFLNDCRVAVVDVRIHQVIVITVLAVYTFIFRPAFFEAFDHVDSFFAILVVEVRPGEMFPRPFEIRIFVATARKSEFRPTFDFV